MTNYDDTCPDEGHSSVIKNLAITDLQLSAYSDMLTSKGVVNLFSLTYMCMTVGAWACRCLPDCRLHSVGVYYTLDIRTITLQSLKLWFQSSRLSYTCRLGTTRGNSVGWDCLLRNGKLS